MAGKPQSNLAQNDVQSWQGKSWSQLFGIKGDDGELQGSSTTPSPDSDGNALFSDAHSKATRPSAPRLPGDNPKGRGVFIYVNGILSNDQTWGSGFIGAVNQTYHPYHQEFMNWGKGPDGRQMSSIAMSDIKGIAPNKLAERISELRSLYPGQPIMVIGHSHGGNIGVKAALDGPEGAPDYVIRMGSPNTGDISPEQLGETQTKVFDVYDPADIAKRTKFPRIDKIVGGGYPQPRSSANWRTYTVQSPVGDVAGVSQHLNVHTPDVWHQMQQGLLVNGFLGPFGGRMYGAVPPRDPAAEKPH